jgi:hypothetical protein
MDDLELEQQAATLRARLLEIWGGDAKRADEYLCWLMQHMAITAPKLPIDQRDVDRARRLMAMLIQR